MSKHPIPDWLRSQFSRIEDEVRKLGPCGVFTQMRTVTQTYFEQQVAAPQPPALGGEPERLMVSFEDHKVGQAALLEHIESLKNQLKEISSQVAPLQAEIDSYKASRERLQQWLREEQLKNIHLAEERDQLKARCDELQCDHEWTDDGEFNLHCTKCGKQENHEPYGWVQTRGNAINHFTQEWDVVEEWEAQGFEYKAMFDAALSKPADQHIPFPCYPPVPDDRKLPADQQGEPVAWVECSPVWLESGGDCAAEPRICVGKHGVSHLHPAHAQPEPLSWTESDVLDFLSVALRHAEYSGLAPTDILDGLRYMAEKGKPAHHAQPATVKVVLPDRMKTRPFQTVDRGSPSYVSAWNACLDEVAKLNTPQ